MVVHEIEGDGVVLDAYASSYMYAPRCASTLADALGAAPRGARQGGRRAATPLTHQRRFSSWGKAWVAQAALRALECAVGGVGVGLELDEVVAAASAAHADLGDVDDGAKGWPKVPSLRAAVELKCWYLAGTLQARRPRRPCALGADGQGWG